MTIDEMHLLVRKYKHLANTNYTENEEKAYVYERFAEFLESYPEIEYFTEDDTEKDLWEHFHEVEAEYDNYWDIAFPEGHDDDEISDWITEE